MVVPTALSKLDARNAAQVSARFQALLVSPRLEKDEQGFSDYGSSIRVYRRDAARQGWRIHHRKRSLHATTFVKLL